MIDEACYLCDPCTNPVGCYRCPTALLKGHRTSNRPSTAGILSTRLEAETCFYTIKHDDGEVRINLDTQWMLLDDARRLEDGNV
jgi:hypothetical protein